MTARNPVECEMPAADLGREIGNRSEALGCFCAHPSPSETAGRVAKQEVIAPAIERCLNDSAGDWPIAPQRSITLSSVENGTELDEKFSTPDSQPNALLDVRAEMLLASGPFADAVDGFCQTYSVEGCMRLALTALGWLAVHTDCANNPTHVPHVLSASRIDPITLNRGALTMCDLLRSLQREWTSGLDVFQD